MGAEHNPELSREEFQEVITTVHDIGSSKEDILSASERVIGTVHGRMDEVWETVEDLRDKMEEVNEKVDMVHKYQRIQQTAHQTHMAEMNATLRAMQARMDDLFALQQKNPTVGDAKGALQMEELAVESRAGLTMRSPNRELSGDPIHLNPFASEKLEEITRARSEGSIEQAAQLTEALRSWYAKRISRAEAEGKVEKAQRLRACLEFC